MVHYCREMSLSVSIKVECLWEVGNDHIYVKLVSIGRHHRQEGSPPNEWSGLGNMLRLI